MQTGRLKIWERNTESGAGIQASALPIFDDDGAVLRYNVFHVELVIRHAEDKKMYLYDIINIKKTSTPLEP